MTLREVLKKSKKSYFIKIVVNNKFYLFNCYKSKMKDHLHSTYIEGYEDSKINNYIINDEHGGHKTVKIYIDNDFLEGRCLYYENLWYNDNSRKEEDVWL